MPVIIKTIIKYTIEYNFTLIVYVSFLPNQFSKSAHMCKESLKLSSPHFLLLFHLALYIFNSFPYEE